MVEIAELEAGDVVAFEKELDGEWRVSDAGVEDVGIFQLPYAAVVQNGTARFLVGNVTAVDEEGEKTVQVRNTENDERMFYLSPDSIHLV